MHNRIFSQYNEIVYGVLIMVVLCLTFVLLQPRTASLVFADKREGDLQDLLATSREEGTVNPYDILKLREHAFPGNFRRIAQASDLTEETVLSTILPEYHDALTPNLVYTSRTGFMSEDYLVNPDSIHVQTVYNALMQDAQKNEVRFSDGNMTVYDKNEKTILVYFVPDDVAKEVHGHFALNELDEKDPRFTPWYWLSVSVVEGL